MASKTSLLSRTVFLEQIKRFTPVWVLYTGVLIFWLPVGLSLRFQNLYKPQSFDLHYLVYSQAPLAAFIVITALFALVCAACLFSYLYKSPSANMMHAFPLKRSTLFISSYLAGLCMLLVPLAIALALYAIVAMAHQVVWWSLVLRLGLCAGLFSVFFFSLATLSAHLSGTVFAAVAFYGLFQFAWSAFSSLLAVFASAFIFGVQTPGMTELLMNSRLSFLSPLPFFLGHISLSVPAFDQLDSFDTLVVSPHVQLTGSQFLLPIVIAALLLAGLAWLLYSIRRVEHAGDMVAFPLLKYPIRWLVAATVGMGAAFVFAALRGFMPNRQMLAVFLGYYTAFALMSFFVTEMILNKTVRVFVRTRLIEAAAMCAVSALVLVALGFDVAGIGRVVPAEADVETVYATAFDVSYAGRVGTTKDAERLLKQTRELHQAIIDHQDELEAQQSDTQLYTNEPNMSVSLAYRLRNGDVLQRTYTLIMNEQALRDPDSPASKLLSLYLDSDLYLDSLLGYNHEGVSWTGAFWSPSDINGPRQSEYPVELAEAKKMGDALVTFIKSDSWKQWMKRRAGLDADTLGEYEYRGTLVLQGRYNKPATTLESLVYDSGLPSYDFDRRGAWSYDSDNSETYTGVPAKSFGIHIGIDTELMESDFTQVLEEGKLSEKVISQTEISPQG